MRRTTWVILVAGLLVYAYAYAPPAVADDLGAPPAGAPALALDEEAPPAPAEPAEPTPAEPTWDGVDEPVEVVIIEADLGDPVPPMPPTEADATETPATDEGPLTAAEAAGWTPAPDEVLPIPTTWVGGTTEGTGYAAVTTVPLATPRRSPGLCCQPRDECGWAIDPCGRRYGRWEVLIEGAFTTIGCPPGELGGAVPAGTPVFDWTENSYCGAPGGRLSVTFRPGPQERIEVRGGYLGQWDGSSQQIGAFGFSPPPGGVSPVGPATLESEAELYGGELNYWRELCCRGKWRFDAGIGMRYVRFEEMARMRGLTLPNAGGTAFLQSDVISELFAAQFGAAIAWDVATRWEISLLGKGLVGLAYDRARVNDVSVLSGGPHASKNEGGEFGWGFEVEGRALFRLTSHLGLTAGVAALYLGETTRASESFDFTQAGTGAVQARRGGDDLFAVSFLLGVHLNF